jgi:DHA2 family multidrug resistance protein-like MFS transporter
MAVGAILLGNFLGVVTTTLLNPALPRIALDLLVAQKDALWAVNAYLIVCSALLLLSAELGSRIGFKSTYIIGALLFLSSSIGCFIAPSIHILVGCRIVQGIGCAAMVTSTMTLLRNVVPVEKFGSALGLNALAIASGVCLGPVIGGAAVMLGDWRLMFVLSAGLSVVSAYLGWRYLPSKFTDGATRTSRMGLALATGAVGLALLAIDVLLDARYLNTGFILLLVAIALAVLFFYQNRASSNAIIPEKLLQNAVFKGALRTSVSAFIAQSAVFLCVPLLLLQGGQYGPLEVALIMLPWPVLTALAAPLSGRMADHGNNATIVIIGVALLLMGVASLCFVGSDSSVPDLVWRIALCGLAFGVFQSPNNRQMILSAGLENASVASALLNLARTAGQAMGVSLVALSLLAASSQGGMFAALAFKIPLLIALLFILLSLVAEPLSLRVKSRRARNL